MVSDGAINVERRLEALERDTAKRLDDARDIHRREHEAADGAHHDLHEAAEQAHREVHVQQRETGAAVVQTYETRFALEEKARDTATAAMEKRLESMNEFRDQLRDQQATFVRREVFDTAVNALMERVTNIEKGDVKQAGQRVGQGAVVGIIVGAVTFVGVILGIVIVVVNIATGTPP